MDADGVAAARRAVAAEEHERLGHGDLEGPDVPRRDRERDDDVGRDHEHDRLAEAEVYAERLAHHPVDGDLGPPRGDGDGEGDGGAARLAQRGHALLQLAEQPARALARGLGHGAQQARARGVGGRTPAREQHQHDEGEQHDRDEDREPRQLAHALAEHEAGDGDQHEERQPVEQRLDEQHVAREGGARQPQQPARQLDPHEVARAQRQQRVDEVGEQEDAEQRAEGRVAAAEQHPPAPGVDALRDGEHRHPGQRPARFEVVEAAQRLGHVDAPDQQRDRDGDGGELEGEQARVAAQEAEHAGQRVAAGGPSVRAAHRARPPRPLRPSCASARRRASGAALERAAGAPLRWRRSGGAFV